MEAYHMDKNGELLNIHIAEDLVTSAGKAAVASLLVSGVTSVSAFQFIAIGSGDTAASTGDVALDEEGVRAKATASRITTTATNDTAQLVFIFGSGAPSGWYTGSTGAQAIDESGVWNELTGGQLLSRQTFNDLNIDWDGGDTLQITWKVAVS